MRKIAIAVLVGWVFGCGASSSNGTESLGQSQKEDSVVAPEPEPAASEGDAAPGSTEPVPSKRDPAPHPQAPLRTVQ